MARIERLRAYPVKGLDALELREARIREGGTLEHDREFALLDADGEMSNGKQSSRFHTLATEYDPETTEIAIDAGGTETRRFTLGSVVDRRRASEWFADFFDADLTLERNDAAGFVDRPTMGPSVISTATLETVASWFDDVTVEGARRRLRANVEVSGVPAFWEDRFVGEAAPAFRAGDIRFEGVTPCGRCVVPQRDPDTGEETPDFRKLFVQNRRATFPDWADPDAFDHFYTLMVITQVPQSDRGKPVRVGDTVEVVEN